jgi:hypothetical protein
MMMSYVRDVSDTTSFRHIYVISFSHYSYLTQHKISVAVHKSHFHNELFPGKSIHLKEIHESDLSKQSRLEYSRMVS